MVCGDNEATWAEIYVVVENKACLKIILWIDFARSAKVAFGPWNLLTFKNFLELRSTVPRSKQSWRNNDPFKLILILFSLGVR
jgi:hypothetical protein